MASKTTHYGLTKPAASDLYDIEVFNSNADAIDLAIHEKHWLGVNPVTSVADDTTVKWSSLGSGLAMYTASSLITAQPNEYGFIQSYTYGSDVYQFWFSLPGGETYRRSGNGDGWTSEWVRMYDNNRVIYSETEPEVVEGGIWLKPI